MSHRRPVHPLLAGLMPDVTTPRPDVTTLESSGAANARIARTAVARLVKQAEQFIAELEGKAIAAPDSYSAYQLSMIAQFAHAMTGEMGPPFGAQLRQAAREADPFDTSTDADDDLAFLGVGHGSPSLCTCGHWSYNHKDNGRDKRSGVGACVLLLDDSTPCPCERFAPALGFTAPEVTP